MGTRLELQTMLETLIDSENVYFQPPENIKLKFPCIIYKRSYQRAIFANNKPYQNPIRYDILLIDRNPDSPLLAKIAALPKCVFKTHYTKDNLNHDVYNIYY